MKIKTWPWVSFFVDHYNFLWTIRVESAIDALRIVGAQFGISHKEFKYMQMTGDLYSAHHKFRQCIRLMATKIGEDPEVALRRYMTLPIKGTP